MLTQAKVRELLDYDPSTGVMRWRARPVDMFKSVRDQRSWNTKHAGKVVGCKNSDGYLGVIVEYRHCKVHRLAWLYMHGDIGELQIDHINGIRDDNRIENLRTVTQSGNSKNAKTLSCNSSGKNGIDWNKKMGKWRARITHQCQCIHLGYFDSLEDAHAKRKEAERLYGFHPNHGRKA